MEWTRLSDLTGNQTYADLAAKAESYLINPLNPELGEPYPGLLGSDVSIANGSFTDSEGGWVGGSDSYYEYLIKMYLYEPTRFASYKDSWVKAVDSSIRYLASHPSSRPDLTFLSYYENGTVEGLVYYSEHRKSTLGLYMSVCVFAFLTLTHLSHMFVRFRFRSSRKVRFLGSVGCVKLYGPEEKGGQSTRHKHMRHNMATSRCPTVRICRTLPVEPRKKKGISLVMPRHTVFQE